MRWQTFAGVAIIGVTALAPNAMGVEKPRDFASGLKDARSVLRLDQGAFVGEAAPILKAAIDQARYVVIGEDHLTREIPLFTAAVCNMMTLGGLDAMAIETGPQVSKLVQRELGRQDVKPALAALARKYPNSAAFMDMQDEAELVSHCAKVAGPDQFRFWGLDQEFIGSTGWLLDLVATHKLSPEASAAIGALRRNDQRDNEAAMQTGDPSKLFMLSTDDAALAITASALRRGSDSAARGIFQELVASHAIYADPSGSHSNRMRALLMKQTFLESLRQIQRPNFSPRVILKFGDTHGYRGLNELHQADLGNFVTELADGEGAQSLHICVLGAGGTHRQFTGYARPTQLQPFVLTDDPSYTWIKPATANLEPAGWTMFDLRKLRFQKFTGLNADWSRMIYGYDLLLIIPKVTPATPLRY